MEQVVTGARLSPEGREAIAARVRAEVRRPPQPQVMALVEALQARLGSQFAGAIYYGSCRRQETVEGLIDLHVLVHDPVAALGRVSGSLCRLLPPNVYYLEVEHGGEPVRCKYAVLSLAGFRRGCSTAAFHSYFWARYAQPLSLIEVDDEPGCIDSLVTAVETLAVRSLPLLRPQVDWRGFWVESLRRCYRAELRAEGGGRAETLVDAHQEYYRDVGKVLLRDLTPRARLPARLGWALRIAVGKPLSLARLLKGLYTFDGGLDYVAWKLERHTGRPVEIPERVRRRPLIHLWPLIYRLWREGMFR